MWEPLVELNWVLISDLEMRLATFDHLVPDVAFFPPFAGISLSGFQASGKLKEWPLAFRNALLEGQPS